MQRDICCCCAIQDGAECAYPARVHKGTEQVPVVIIGGGICGLLAAERCVKEGNQVFVIRERG